MIPRIAKEEINGTKSDSTATIGFEAKLWLTDEQAEPAPHFVAAEYSGARPEGLLGLNFQLIAQLDESSFQPSMSCGV